MNDELDFINIKDWPEEEELQKMGTEQYVKLTSLNNALYVSSAAANCIPGFKPFVRIGKAGKYLLFHFTDSKKGFHIVRTRGGFFVSFRSVISKTGIRPEQINGKRPKLIKDGFAIELY